MFICTSILVHFLQECCWHDVQFTSLVLHFHYLLMYLTECEWCKLDKIWYFCWCWSICWYCFELILYIIDFSRMNVAQSSAVLLDGIGFSTLFPVSLLMIWNSPLVFFLFLFIWFEMTCFSW